MYRELGDDAMTADVLDELGCVAVALQRPERALRLFGAASTLRDAAGSSAVPSCQEERDEHLVALRESLGEAAFETLHAEGRAMHVDQAVAYAVQKES